MKKKKYHILIVDDETGIRESMKMLLEDDYHVSDFSNPAEALKSFDHEKYHLVFLDISMPKMNGIEFLKKLREKGSDILVIMLTATKTIKTAVQCMKLGAYDYITKPYSIEEILEVTEKSIKDYEERQKHYIKNSPRNDFESFYTPTHPQKVIGKETTLSDIFKKIKKISKTDSTILLTGESGTGKEVIARAIHDESTRNKKPFFAVHLSAIPEKLIESELFGHLKGSFTGADKDHIGFIEAADGGTLFLDEIGDIPLSVQVKLLRTIQEKEYRKVGSHSSIKVNIRFIAATNKDLMIEVQKKRFREDLYYRLNVIPIHIAPLRCRKEDIPELVSYFSKLISNKLYVEPIPFSEEVIDIFKQYQWPGNIRELQNTVENMTLMNDLETIEKDLIPRTIVEVINEEQEKDIFVRTDTLQLEEHVSLKEKEIITNALSISRGLITEAAEKLGTTRRILKYKMDKLGINQKIFKKGTYAKSTNSKI